MKPSHRCPLHAVRARSLAAPVVLRAAVLAVLLVFWLQATPLTAACPPAEDPLAGPVPYPPNPDWKSAKGYCGTGLAFADINGDGWLDMVVSNGNDIARQDVWVHYNRGDGCFNPEPDWTSDDTAFNGNLAVGDLNHDGWPDVAVSVYTGPDHTYAGGGAKVYMNQGPPDFLETTPSWSVTGFPSFGLALGDADGDGDLDLAVAAGNPIAETETFAAQPDCVSPYLQPADRSEGGESGTAGQEPPYVSNGFVFYNSGGALNTKPGWTSRDKLVAMDVAFADVDADGAVDLIYGDSKPSIYLGDGQGGISRSPDWRATEESYFSNQMDFAATLDLPDTADGPGEEQEGQDRKSPVASLLVAGNSYMGGGPGRFDLFRFTSTYILEYEPRTSSPSWSSARGEWGSGVLFADVEGDGDLDLFAGRWAEPGSGVLGAPLEVYLGDGTLLDEEPTWSSQTRSVVEIVAVADLRNLALTTRSQTFEPDEGESWSVLTLDRQTVQEVVDVTVDGRKLAPSEYAATPGGNLVYLATPLRGPAEGDGEAASPGQEAVVRFSISPVLDVGVTNWDCKLGNYLFYSRRAPGGSGDT